MALDSMYTTTDWWEYNRDEAIDKLSTKVCEFREQNSISPWAMLIWNECITDVWIEIRLDLWLSPALNLERITEEICEYIRTYWYSDMYDQDYIDCIYKYTEILNY